jgi:hypothetical protein
MGERATRRGDDLFSAGGGRSGHPSEPSRSTLRGGLSRVGACAGTASYAEYRRSFTGLLDVGLMPLTDTPYNRAMARSMVKYG